MAGSDASIDEIVADKGYHKTETLAWLDGWGLRGYIPERRTKQRRNWKDKPAKHKASVYGNRRRVNGDRGKWLQRKRSEFPERSFAHVCETGGARRTWLRGRIKVAKRYLIQVAAHNLGAIMRALFGVGTPRSLQGGNRPGIGGRIPGFARQVPLWVRFRAHPAVRRFVRNVWRRIRRSLQVQTSCAEKAPFSTGC